MTALARSRRDPSGLHGWQRRIDSSREPIGPRTGETVSRAAGIDACRRPG